MNQPRLTTQNEKNIYQMGYKAGYSEGMKKAAMIIQLAAGTTEQFAESVLQNSPEVIELRKIMTGKE